MKNPGCPKSRITLLIAAVISLLASSGWAASSATRVSIHVPSKSLSIMP